MHSIKKRYVQIKELQNKGKQLTLCTHCGDIHYKGFWYASDSQFALSINEKEDSVQHQMCPACRMIRKGGCAGELRITDVPENLISSVFLVIQRAAEQDYAENPQHRILNFTAADDGYNLTATSVKMIRRIRRSILDVFDASEAQSVYKKGRHSLQITDISFSLPGYFNKSVTK